MRKECATENKKENLLKKPIKIAAISGILIFALVIVNYIILSILNKVDIQILSTIYSLIYNILLLASIVAFNYGFFLLGKKYNSSFLRIISVIIIFFIIFIVIFSATFASSKIKDINSIVLEKATSLGINPAEGMTQEQQQALGQELLQDKEFLSFALLIVVLLAIYALIFSILSVLLGVGLIKLKDKAEYAKTAGILEIVGGATALIVVGFLIIFIAKIFEIIILFNESKKLEK